MTGVGREAEEGRLKANRSRGGLGSVGGKGWGKCLHRHKRQKLKELPNRDPGGGGGVLGGCISLVGGGEVECALGFSGRWDWPRALGAPETRLHKCSLAPPRGRW